MIDPDCKHKEDADKLNVEHEALWLACRKYLGLVCGGIFAIVLARPDLPRQIVYAGITLNKVIETYIFFGVLGVYLAAIWEALAKKGSDAHASFPLWIQKLFVVYTFTGFALFGIMFRHLMRQ